MKNYKYYYSEHKTNSPIPLVIIWIVAAYLVANLAWEQIFNYFGF